ncbi:MAG TPA: hypothetical protein VLS87_03125 [Woeseiaceae bacterium]|nr:hypothetical protein [Woeseiaceae bacterium]
MKSISLKLVFAVVAVSLLPVIAGCSRPADEPAAGNPALATPVPPGMVRGTVLETMDSGGYTYAFLETGQDQRWVAALQTPVAVGDVVQVDAGMIMTDFTSNTLGRSFDVVYFVSGLQNLTSGSPPPPQAAAGMPAAGGMPAGHPDISGGGSAATAAAGVEAFEAGKDIAYVYANKDELAGSEITLRGKVVKYNPGILGWNFIHIQDGSGDAAAGTNDLIVTTKAATAVGDTVVLTGNIVLDKDFGAGYSYPVLLEDASISTE